MNINHQPPHHNFNHQYHQYLYPHHHHHQQQQQQHQQINHQISYNNNNQYHLPTTTSSMIIPVHQQQPQQQYSRIDNWNLVGNYHNHNNCNSNGYLAKSLSSIETIPVSILPSPINSSPSYSKAKNLLYQIKNEHFSYVNRDETLSKYTIREHIEKMLQEYLTLISHSQKFSFREIKDCFELTISRRQFDAEKTIRAFETIEKYATNLLNYPWRHEFHLIFAFNGIFHRYIRSCLVGYEEVMELLGYSYNSKMDTYKLVDVPIDPDKMIQISLECLIAIIEIQIMIKIKSLTVDMTWKDIFHVRSKHICTAQSAIKLFEDLKQNNRLIDLDLDLPDYSVKKFDQFDQLEFLSPTTTTNHNHYDNEESENLIAPPPNYLESDLDSIDFIDTDKKQNFTVTNHQSPKKFIVEDINSFASKKAVSVTVQNSHESPKSKKYSIDSMINSSKEENGKESGHSRSSSLGPNRRTTSAIASTYNTPTYSSIASTYNSVKNGSNIVSILQDKTKDASPLVVNVADDTEMNGNKTWACSACTYANDDKMEICEMCHRSRRKGPESTPLMTGGRECNKCTLVNNKTDLNCRACGTSLADSPTYI